MIADRPTAVGGWEQCPKHHVSLDATRSCFLCRKEVQAADDRWETCFIHRRGYLVRDGCPDCHDVADQVDRELEETSLAVAALRVDRDGVALSDSEDLEEGPLGFFDPDEEGDHDD